MTEKRILILTTSHTDLGDSGKSTGIWLEELTTPYYVFLDAGANITIASLTGGEVPIDPASQSFEGNAPVSVERFLEDTDAMKMLKNSPSLDQLSVSDFQAIFLPGGHGAMFDLAESEQLGNFLSEAWARGEIISAVCHGPAGLAHALDETEQPIVYNRKVAGFSNSEEQLAGLTKVVPFLLEDKLKQLGAKYSKGKDFTSYAVADGHLVTGQNPQSSEETARLVLEALV